MARRRVEVGKPGGSGAIIAGVAVVLAVVGAIALSSSRTDEASPNDRRPSSQIAPREFDALEEKATEIAKARLAERMKPLYAAGVKPSDEEMQKLLDLEKVRARGELKGSKVIGDVGRADGFTESEIQAAIGNAFDHQQIEGIDERGARFFLDQARNVKAGDEQIRGLK